MALRRVEPAKRGAGGGVTMAWVSPEATGLAAPTDAGFGRRICVEVERTVDASMERVWGVLRDYRAARPRMLTEHFADYAVQQEEGERTVIDYRLRVGRHERRYVAAVEEPMAGRQLCERDLRSGCLTAAVTAGSSATTQAPRHAGLEVRAGYELEFFLGRDAEGVQPAHGAPASSPSATASRTPARAGWSSSIWLSSPSRSPRISWRLRPTSRTAARRWRLGA